MKELTAQDLRIGNLVNYKYFNPDPKNPNWAFQTAEIVELKQKGFLFKHLNGKSKYKIDTLYSIPLTEEWLERFGFEKVNISMFHDRFNFKNISIIRGSVFYFYETEIESVHHLQNIVHALTGEELTLKTQG
jgi:hypothetical protein